VRVFALRNRGLRAIMAPFIFQMVSRGDAMATYSTNEFKSGLKVMLDGDPCSILENEFVKPGKGQAFNRVKTAQPQDQPRVGKDLQVG
jgi:hypothetical protein